MGAIRVRISGSRRLRGPARPLGLGWLWGLERRPSARASALARPRRRLFEQGDLKFVILRLLEEKPRHGYEIIKEIESRFGGSYSPSPGTVYPTLTMLEDLGLRAGRARGERQEDLRDHRRGPGVSRRAQHADRRHLRADRAVCRRIYRRQPMMELNQAFQRLARATYKTATSHINDKEKIQKIREIIQRAAEEIEATVK